MIDSKFIATKDDKYLIFTTELVALLDEFNEELMEFVMNPDESTVRGRRAMRVKCMKLEKQLKLFRKRNIMFKKETE